MSQFRPLPVQVQIMSAVCLGAEFRVLSVRPRSAVPVPPSCEHPPITPDEPQVLAVEVEGVAVLADVDRAYQHLVARVGLGQRLVGLVGEQGVVVALEEVGEDPAVDEVDGREALVVGEVAVMAALHLRMDVRIDLAQQIQELLVVVGPGAVAIGRFFPTAASTRWPAARSAPPRAPSPDAGRGSPRPDCGRGRCRACPR